MIVAKLVDLVTDPATAARDGDLYADGGALLATDILISSGQTVCARTWTPLLNAFIAAARDPTAAKATELAAQLAAAVTECEGRPMQDVLAWALAPRRSCSAV